MTDALEWHRSCSPAHHAFGARDCQQTLVYATRASERALTMLAPRAAIEHAEAAMHAAAAWRTDIPVEIYSRPGRAHGTLADFAGACAD